MKLKINHAFFFLYFFCQLANGQVEKFVYNVENEKGRLDVDKITNIVRPKDTHNLFLLSEDKHSYRNLELAITLQISSLSRKYLIDQIFCEYSYAEHKMMTDIFKHPLNVDSFLNGISKKYHNSVMEDLRGIELRPYNNFIAEMTAVRLLDKIIPIDIGTGTFHLSIFYLAGYTKRLNTTSDNAINWFCDSITQQYSLEYHGALETRNDTWYEYEQKMARINIFLEALDKYDNLIDVSRAWRNVFSSYFRTRYNMLRYPDGKQTTPLKLKHVRKYMSFRDSILFNNLRLYFPPKKEWQNVIVTFSSYHLLDTRNGQLFSEVLDSSTHTLGKYLHKEYKKMITHIVFVCNSGIITNGNNNNKKHKKSLEYKLAKDYNFAYVDLRAYRQSKGDHKPFYLRPTFEKYIKTNWEDLIDGIVFIKDCGCTTSSKSNN